MRLLMIFSLFAFFSLSSLFSQTDDQVLFTVSGQPVTTSEFTYIYGKNNREDADYSERSLREYLDLYTKFKLKVREAYAMRLDTITSLKNELDGYRKQLAESYLTDKEITDRLVQEAYSRMQEDVHVAHILARSNPNVATDTLAAYEKIQKIYKELQSGAKWEDVARRSSDDNTSKEVGGDVGYIAALLPSGFYAFETAAYTTPKGTYSAPVRSSIGYHIVKVLDKRPARGEMDVAHILFRVKSDNSNDKYAKAKADSVYNQILRGMSFEEAARKESEDKMTAERGGFIGGIAINQYERSFEEAAFGLAKDGDISAPVRTRLGWHIIKRSKKRPVLTYEASKRKIETQLGRDDRIAIARQAMVNRIKKDAGYTVNQVVFNELVEKAGPDLQTYRWQVPTVTPAVVLTLGNDTYTNVDFANYVRNNARVRMGMAKGTSNKEILEKVFNDFVNEKALYYEERNLANKYPEFKALMREYEEGIMLFEATKLNVWDKASRDTIGLKAFHADHRMDYMWEERIELATVTMDSSARSKLPTIKKWIAKQPLAVVVNKAAKKKIPITVTRRVYHKDESLPTGITWTANQRVDLPDGSGFVIVEKIIPPQPKSLDEARGYIIADYQDQLEKEWVASLQKKYPVQVNEDVFKSLIKK